jgi:hypothetical protein
MADLAQQSIARLKLRILGFGRLRNLCSHLFVVPALRRGMLVSLFGEFVRCQVICFVVRNNSGGMGVLRKAVEFSGLIVCALWHGLPSWI